MALLDQLTRQESDALWWRMLAAAEATAQEIANLARCRRGTRTELYGPGILEATVGVLADLEDVLETDLPPTLTRAALALVAPKQPEV